MLMNLLKTRRSIRKYQQKPIEQEKIDAIIKAAITSPSGRNLKPCELIVVTDKGIIQKLNDAKAGSDFLAEASLAIVVIADAEITNTWVEDASIMSTIIQLAAHEQGLGTCWSQMKDKVHNDKISSEDYIKNLLGIPEKYRILNIIAIGYPAEEKSPHNTDSLPLGKIHYNKF